MPTAARLVLLLEGLAVDLSTRANVSVLAPNAVINTVANGIVSASRHDSLRNDILRNLHNLGFITQYNVEQRHWEPKGAAFLQFYRNYLAQRNLAHHLPNQVDMSPFAGTGYRGWDTHFHVSIWGRS